MAEKLAGPIGVSLWESAWHAVGPEGMLALRRVARALQYDGGKYYPSVSEAEPVWKYINKEAIDKARSLLTAAKDPRAKDQAQVVGHALRKLVDLRDKIGGPYCNDINLAYADHYMQMRAEGNFLGPPLSWAMFIQVIGYDAAKRLGIVLRSGKCDPSPSTNQSIYWGMKGLEDGLEDWSLKWGPSLELMRPMVDPF